MALVDPDAVPLKVRLIGQVGGGIHLTVDQEEI
jgi:hypothetical protein